ncbi:hypothetical protein ACWEOO_23435 [Kribbella sp. NPDC004138]
MVDEPAKHITEALSGQFVAPLPDAERVEHERARVLVRAVLSAYNGLIAAEADEARRRELETERAVHTERFRRFAALSAEERSEILRSYPGLLSRLRAG